MIINYDMNDCGYSGEVISKTLLTGGDINWCILKKKESRLVFKTSGLIQRRSYLQKGSITINNVRVQSWGTKQLNTPKKQHEANVLVDM